MFNFEKVRQLTIAAKIKDFNAIHCPLCDCPNMHIVSATPTAGKYVFQLSCEVCSETIRKPIAFILTLYEHKGSVIIEWTNEHNSTIIEWGKTNMSDR